MLSRRQFAAVLAVPFRRSKVSILGTTFRVMRNSSGKRHYLHIHGDEKTAREVLTEHMKQTTGEALLIDNEERNIPVPGGKLDPNRMFSRAGAEKNLRALNPQWDSSQAVAVLDQLDKERDKLLKSILPDKEALLIALHNNTPGEYTVLDEAKISDATSLNDEKHPDEFLLCTHPADFELLRKGPFNTVLQSKVGGDDDGSLSRLCAARGTRYLNIEATHGNAEAQRKMLHWIELALP